MYRKWSEQLSEIVEAEFPNEDLQTVGFRLGLSDKVLERSIYGDRKRIQLKVYTDLFDLFYYELVITKDRFVYAGDPLTVFELIFQDYKDTFDGEMRASYNYSLRKWSLPRYNKVLLPLSEMGFDISFQKVKHEI